MYGVVDRIEENIAVICVEDYNTFINIPLNLLPKCINEGDYLSLSFTYDEQKTRAAYDEAINLFNK